MITLEVAKYCHNCPEFEPEATRTQIYADDINTVDSHVNTDTVDSHVNTDTVVTCMYKDRCRCIYKNIKRTRDAENE